MKDNTLDIKTVCECNRCLGCKTLHPQVSIINLENPNVYQDAVKFEFYAKKRAEEMIAKGGLSDHDYKIVEAKLQRALVRLSVKN